MTETLKTINEKEFDLDIQSGETEYGYIIRICEQKDCLGTWADVAEFLNEKLNRNWTESAYRKKYQMYCEAAELIFNNRKDDTLTQLEEVKKSIQLERIKLQQTKKEYNKWVRAEASFDMLKEELAEIIESNVAAKPAPNIVFNPKSRDKVGVLCLADMHFGAEFTVRDINGDIINEYSPEVFMQRMEYILEKTHNIVIKEDIEILKVLNLGDALDGFLRHKQAWDLRYGVVESAVELGSYLADWLDRLSRLVTVEYHYTVGNHGELRLLDGVKGAHFNENMEFIVASLIKTHNKNNPNLIIVEPNAKKYITTKVAGINLLGIHGEVSNLGTALKDYISLYNTKIDYLIAGHKHRNYNEEVGLGRSVIGIGSIMGIDNYAADLRLGSNPSANLLIFEEGKGKTIDYTINLKELN